MNLPPGGGYDVTDPVAFVAEWDVDGVGEGRLSLVVEDVTDEVRKTRRLKETKQ